MSAPRAALAAIDAAFEDWLDRESGVRALAPMVVLALHASGYEIRPALPGPDPRHVVADGALEALRSAGFEIRPTPEDRAA